MDLELLVKGEFWCLSVWRTDVALHLIAFPRIAKEPEKVEPGVLEGDRPASLALGRDHGSGERTIVPLVSFRFI